MESNTSRSFVDQPSARSPISAVAYRAAEANLRTLAATVDPSDPLVGVCPARHRIYDGFGTPLQRLDLSSEPVSSEHLGQALLVVPLHEAFAGIKLPSSTHITLPAARAKIPITVRNGTPRAIPILVRLSSPRA